MATQDPENLIDDLIADWRRERPGTRAEPMAVVGRILRLGRRYEEEASRLLRPHGLSYSDFDVLATLRRAGAPYALSPTVLQRRVLLSSGAMTACLRRLEGAGLVARQGDARDRRRLTANLTTRGCQMVESLIDARFALAQASVCGLSARDRTTLESLLRALEDTSAG